MTLTIVINFIDEVLSQKKKTLLMRWAMFAIVLVITFIFSWNKLCRFNLKKNKKYIYIYIDELYLGQSC
jgi:hypothetical protein